MQVIPVQAVGNQTLYVQLNGQNTQLNIYQQEAGLFMDVICATMVNGGLFGVICQNLNRIVRDLYLGFQGELTWNDNQGGNNPLDPIYTGLGTRFSLIYILPSELPANIG